MKPDPWIILGIHPGADVSHVRAAWRRQISRWHPDRNPSPEATLRLQQINAAYACIESGTDALPPSSMGHPILAGLFGTVFGHDEAQATTSATDTIHVDLDLPADRWAMDEPITLAMALSEKFATIVTLVHPRRFHDGSAIVFEKSALSARGHPTDLVVTLRVGLARFPPPTAVASTLAPDELST